VIEQAQQNLYGWKSLAATPAHEYVWPAILRLLPSYTDPEIVQVLDLGCGNGYIASRLHELGFSVTGVDASPDGIALARQAYPEIDFQTASIYDNLSIPHDGMFDLVVSSEVIEHLYYPRLLLRNAFAALKVGGTIIVTTPYHGYLKNLALSIAGKWDDHHAVHWDGGHIKFFSERTLKSMLEETGFTDIRFSNAGRVPWLWKSMVCSSIRSESK